MNIEKGFHSTGTNGIKGIIEHEIGHFIDDKFRLSSLKAVKNIYTGIMNEKLNVVGK